MGTRTDTLNALLADQTDDGLVNFNNITKCVTKIPAGVPALLRKGGLGDVKNNLVNLENGDETRVVRKEKTTYYVDPRLAVAFIKFNCKDLDVQQWERVYGRADIPEQLGDEAPALLRHLMSVFDNSKFRCTFQDGKWYFCLHDVVQAATGDQTTNRRHLERALQLDTTLIDECVKTHSFYNSGEMQIVDINTAGRVWMVLPGRKASIFRSNLADLFIRVLGGDATLADDIKQIGEFQDTLPETHPLRNLRRHPSPIVDRAPPPSYQNDVTNLLTIITDMDARFKQFQEQMERRRREDREDMMRAVERLGTVIQANANRMDALMVDHQNPGIDLQCQYNHLIRSIDSVNVDGVTDYNFRAEFNAFCITIANVFFHTLEQKSSVATADFIKDLLNVEVVFARPMTRWSSLCTRTLLQGCVVLRIHQWICKERGLTYPNAAVKNEIRHSTYLNLQCYFSLLSHFDRVWEEREYEGSVVLGNMISALFSKFGTDLNVYKIDGKIDYHYGARRASDTSTHSVQLPPTNAEKFIHFLKSTIDRVDNNFIGVQYTWDRYNEYAPTNDLPPITSRVALIKRVNDSNFNLRSSKSGNQIIGWNIIRPKTKFQLFLRHVLDARVNDFITTQAMWEQYRTYAPLHELPLSDPVALTCRVSRSNEFKSHTTQVKNKIIGWSFFASRC